MITIRFEDKGQDFIEWDVDVDTEKVVDCRPFQASIWTKYYVSNLLFLTKGDCVHICNEPIDYSRDDQDFLTINYRVISVKNA